MPLQPRHTTATNSRAMHDGSAPMTPTNDQLQGLMSSQHRPDINANQHRLSAGAPFMPPYHKAQQSSFRMSTKGGEHPSGSLAADNFARVGQQKPNFSSIDSSPCTSGNRPNTLPAARSNRYPIVQPSARPMPTYSKPPADQCSTSSEDSWNSSCTDEEFPAKSVSAATAMQSQMHAQMAPATTPAASIARDASQCSPASSSPAQLAGGGFVAHPAMRRIPGAFQRRKGCNYCCNLSHIQQDCTERCIVCGSAERRNCSRTCSLTEVGICNATSYQHIVTNGDWKRTWLQEKNFIMDPSTGGTLVLKAGKQKGYAYHSNFFHDEIQLDCESGEQGIVIGSIRRLKEEIGASLVVGLTLNGKTSLRISAPTLGQVEKVKELVTQLLKERASSRYARIDAPAESDGPNGDQRSVVVSPAKHAAGASNNAAGEGCVNSGNVGLYPSVPHYRSLPFATNSASEMCVTEGINAPSGMAGHRDATKWMQFKERVAKAAAKLEEIPLIDTKATSTAQTLQTSPNGHQGVKEDQPYAGPEPNVARNSTPTVSGSVIIKSDFVSGIPSTSMTVGVASNLSPKAKEAHAKMVKAISQKEQMLCPTSSSAIPTTTPHMHEMFADFGKNIDNLASNLADLKAFFMDASLHKMRAEPMSPAVANPSPPCEQCKSRPRSILFDCSHYTLCYECAHVSPYCVHCGRISMVNHRLF